MFSAATILGLYTETSAHPGAGASSGAIDLPVQREAHTGFPMLVGSSIKGVMRDRRRGDPDATEVFGPDIGSGGEHSGAVSVCDARILMFPIRASSGIFAWTTCPFVLKRLARDFDAAGMPQSLNVPADPREGVAIAADGCVLTSPLLLEDEDFVIEKALAPSVVDAICRLMPPQHEWMRARVATHLLVVPDESFARLVGPGMGTEVSTRIVIDNETGTSKNMWTEETLPSDCLFYSIVFAMPSRKATTRLDSGDKVVAALHRLSPDGLLQIGGDETVGRGWMRGTWVEGGDA